MSLLCVVILNTNYYCIKLGDETFLGVLDPHIGCFFCTPWIIHLEENKNQPYIGFYLSMDILLYSDSYYIGKLTRCKILAHTI